MSPAWGTPELVEALASYLPIQTVACFRLACKAFRDHCASRSAPRTPFLTDPHLARWAMQQPGFASGADVLALAAQAGNVEVLAALHALGVPFACSACAAAAKAGHIHALEWLRAEGCEWDSSATAEAAAGGQLHVLRWLVEHGCELDDGVCVETALAGGHPHVASWVRCVRTCALLDLIGRTLALASAAAPAA
ncbi:hypothetical protein KFE25_007455 [Diacronema lutheri]|uniref:Uncharacterized protein n=1 Tax=Diacronema lutheri TaxID=2081491 RepID=A0A8J6CBN0_DIALT|nr:hypothetical protein KFE25_007455 [Diacronema lutheri]